MQKVGLLAGDGRLPTLLSEHVSFHHIVDLAYWPLPLGALDALVEALQGQGCDAVILAGGVDRRRFRALDAGGQWVAARAGADAGDGRLLDAFVAYFESQGLAVVGATDLVPSLRTPVGLLTRGGTTLDPSAGLARARALGRKDLGQGVVQCGERLWLEETAAGTNDLLSRAGDAGIGPRTLFKAAKPQQDLRIDMPAWGLETVLHAAKHDVQTLVFEAEKTLALDFEQAIAQAETLGLTIMGAQG